MTPEQENACRAACRRCTEEIRKAMSKRPKPNWEATVKPIIWQRTGKADKTHWVIFVKGDSNVPTNPARSDIR